MANQDFQAVIDKLPHSKSRMPYTYHHDHLRRYTARFAGASRSDVAQAHKENEDELYAVALTALLNDLGANALMCIAPSDVMVCRQAIRLCDEVVARYAA